MIPKRDYYEGLLLPNASWLDLPERHMMLRMIYKDLGELYAEDDEFATEVSFVLKNWLATANWQFKSGPIPIWKSMFSRAKGVVRKRSGNGDLEILSKGLLKHATKAETRTESVSKPVGFSSPPSRPGSGTGRTRSNATESGGG